MFEFNFNDPQDIVRFIQVASVFGLVISIWLCGVLLWSSRRAKRTRELQKRIGLSPSDDDPADRVLRLWRDGKEATTIVSGTEADTGLRHRIDNVMRQADWRTPLSTSIMGIAGVLGAVFLATFLLTASPIIAVLGDLAVVLIFWILLGQRIARRTAVFERQLIDALELAARSLRAGHPLVGAFRLIADEVPAPVGELFGRVWQQQQLGSALEGALSEEAIESGSEDAKLFATSVRIQLRSGGNLADMMQRLAEVIRERSRLARRIHVLTAQTQFSKRVLLAMPFLMFVLLNVINPRYIAPLYDTPGGHTILIIAASTLMFGWWVMNRMSKLTW